MVMTLNIENKKIGGEREKDSDCEMRRLEAGRA